MEASYLIRRARADAGLTQIGLAARMGVPQSVVARLESPGSNPTWRTLASALGAMGYEIELRKGPRPERDLGQLRARLALSPAERLAVFEESQASLQELTATARFVDG